MGNGRSVRRGLQRRAIAVRSGTEPDWSRLVDVPLSILGLEWGCQAMVHFTSRLGVRQPNLTRSRAGCNDNASHDPRIPEAVRYRAAIPWQSISGHGTNGAQLQHPTAAPVRPAYGCQLGGPAVRACFQEARNAAVATGVAIFRLQNGSRWQ